MASRKPTGNKMTSKATGASRASASAKPPAPLRAKTGVASIAPKPLAKVPESKATDLKSGEKAIDRKAKNPAAKTPDSAAPDGATPLKKQELITQVVERSGIAKKYAKPAAEAMLAVLGEAIAQGRDLNLQPMGKIKRKRVKDSAQARVTVANIRQPVAAAAGSVVEPDPKGGLKPVPAPPSPVVSTPAASGPKAGTRPRHPLKEAVAEGGEDR